MALKWHLKVPNYQPILNLNMENRCSFLSNPFNFHLTCMTIMKKTIFILVSIFCFSCSSSESKKVTTNEPEQAINQQKADTSLPVEQKTSEDTSVEEPLILMRTNPSSDEIILKLSKNETFEILDKSEKEDDWYKITAKGKEGWVQGSQIDTKLKASFLAGNFNTFVIAITKAVQAGESIKDYIYPGIQVYMAQNPGVACTGYRTDEPDIIIKPTLTNENIFSRLPKGDFCEGYTGEKDGIYCVEISQEKLPSFVTYNEDGDQEKLEITIPENVTCEKIVKAILVSNENHESYLYFVRIDSKWYILCQDLCDCSA